MQIGKKKLGLTVLLLAVLSVSVVYGAYLVTTESSSANVNENVSYTLTHDFSDIYPSETTSWAFAISNAGGVAQDVMITGSDPFPSGVSVSAVTIDGSTYTWADLQAGITQSVPAAGSISVSIEVSAASDSATGTFTVTVMIERV